MGTPARVRRKTMSTLSTSRNRLYGFQPFWKNSTSHMSPQGFRSAQLDDDVRLPYLQLYVRLTDQTLSCAARAHVVTAARPPACTHVSRAMQPARRRPVFDFTSRLGRRAEAGPRQLLRRVGLRP